MSLVKIIVPKFLLLLLLSILFITNLAQADQKPCIISGFDDVLRQAENTGLIKAALKILEDDKGFSGMSEMYQVMAVLAKLADGMVHSIF